MSHARHTVRMNIEQYELQSTMRYTTDRMRSKCHT